VSSTERRDASEKIELSTVCFYSGPTPQVIRLQDCNLPLVTPIAGALSAFYGTKSKADGFMAARAYADAHRLQFTVIDFVVKMDVKVTPLSMHPEDLPERDFLSFQRLTRRMREEVGEIFRRKLAKEGGDLSEVDFSQPHLLLVDRPDLIKSLMSRSEFAHVKIIAHPATLEISERPLMVGIVPYSHWSAIQEATCRLNPTIQVTLEPPGRAKRQAPVVVTAPKKNLRERIR